MSIAIRGAALALLLAGPRLGWSQQTTLAWPHPGQLIKEGVALHDKEDYPGAIAKYQAVTPGDSSYATAQSELAMSLEAAGKHAEAVAAARRALALHPFEPQTYNTLATAQESLKQIDEALATYAAGIKLFPYNQNLVYNQGVVQFQQNRPAEALASFQRSLELYPTHPNTHRLLAVLAAEQGQTSRALLGWLTYLVLANPGPTAHDVLVAAETLSQGAPVVEDKERIKPIAPNEAFVELDQLIEGRVALQAGYASKVKFPASVVKQTQLLVEKFPLDGPADDFWVRTYGPMVAALRQNDHLTAFTYSILESADDKRAAQWVKGNKSKIDAMMGVVVGALSELRTKQRIVGQSAAPRVAGWFDKNALVGLGPGVVDAAGDFKGSGDWISIDAASGYVDGHGQYNAAGQKVGEWKAFRPDGSLEQVYHYNDKGEREGLTREFHRNGQPSYESTYRAGKVEGVLTVYNECGARTGSRTFKAGDLDGPYSTYYDNGQLHMRTTTHADKVDGLEEGFYQDGSPEYTTTMAQGVRQGPFTSYYPGKVLERKGTYDHDDFDGAYQDFHDNGQLSAEGRYVHGKQAGTWKEYHPNGKPSVEKSFDEAGKLHGMYRDYDETGHLYCDTEYAHGRTAHLRYYNRQGQPVLDQDTRKGRVVVQLPDADGHKNATGTFLNGELVGEWQWFYTDGGRRELSHFDDKGTKTGVAELYYHGGQLQRRTRYDAEGREDGLFEQFSLDGQPSVQGYYLAGQRHGQWKDFYADGRLSEDYEYFKGDFNGPSRSYEPGGKPTQERQFEFGKLRHITTYDSTGQVLANIALRPDSKDYVMPYPNGKPYFRSGLGCYDNGGLATWYRPDGSVETTAEQLGGRRNGAFRSTFANGKPDRVGQFRNGEYTGEWLTYYPSGQLRQKSLYRNGNQEGEWTSYFPNGQVEFVEQYEGSQQHGHVRRYNPAGELLTDKQYEHGVLASYRGPVEGSAAQTLPNQTGSINLNFANGKPAVAETYDHNQAAGTATYYYASGAVFRRTTFAKGRRTGLLESFYPNGKPMEQENYLHGELNGRCRYYRPDGTLEREETYRSGERRGPTTTFDAAGKPQHTDVYWNLMVYNK
ncbi:tetratricopeptide repeat protein [Hymenobacter sp. UYCo722]|uniref:tetratricopeptide repeat protein n=1 Tax=Hymenobacter sp. UYCo722 TaxID=3156335 RepID=UPI0033978331